MVLRRSSNVGELDKVLDDICEEEERRLAAATAEATRLEIEAAEARRQANAASAAMIGTGLESVEEEETQAEADLMARTENRPGGRSPGVQSELARNLFGDDEPENDADKTDGENIDGEDMEDETVKEVDEVEDGVDEDKPLSPVAASDEAPTIAAETAKPDRRASQPRKSSGPRRASQPRKSSGPAAKRKAALKKPAGVRLFICDRFRDISYWVHK